MDEKAYVIEFIERESRILMGGLMTKLSTHYAPQYVPECTIDIYRYKQKWYIISYIYIYVIRLLNK